MEPAEERVGPDDIRIVLSINRLGELIGGVCEKFCQERGIEPPEYGESVDDDSEMKRVSVYAWKYVLFMHDRENFVDDVERDLARLLEEPAPEHRSEFDL